MRTTHNTMRWWLIIIAVLGICLGIIGVVVAQATQVPSENKEINLIAPVASLSPSDQSPSGIIELIGEPRQLIIPKLQVQAAVESVGLDEQQRMDVPTKDEHVAWYQLGPKPGERGSAVLAGHLDTKTGGQAVFYDLDKLQPGDEIKIKDENGQEIKFVVERSELYTDANFPLKEVFENQQGEYLNLITCAGDFSQENSNYSHRRVVFAKRVE